MYLGAVGLGLCDRWKAFGDEVAFGMFSAFERLHRGSMLYAYLFQTPTGAIGRAGTYLAVDPSEKGNISYALGMTLAKLFSEVALATPRLLHYATYAADYAITVGAGASRPDLIGETTAGEWVVFEAKGRSNGLEAGVLDVAKAQSLQILTIDGLVPVCRVGMAAYFAAGVLRFSVQDPEGRGHRKVDLTRQRFEAGYNRPLSRLIEARGATARRRIDGHEYIGADFREADLFLSFSPGEAEGRGRALDDSAYLGGDGLLVQLGPSWREDRMLLQPHLR